MTEWRAEIEVDETLARELLGAQFPELELRTLQFLGAGWDNTVWRVDGEWAFRFPRRQVAIAGVERELAVLQLLAAHLPLPVPEPVFVGAPSGDYPWPFFGARYLAGGEPADAGLDDEGRARLAEPLAAFLRALHAVDARVELPEDPLRRADMAFRVPRAEQMLVETERGGLWRAPPRVAGILEAARGLPVPPATAIVHGDLHLRHVLIDDGRLSAVIDWGDSCRADPCVDLILYWSLLPPAARAAFLDAYGPVEEEQLLRARVLSLLICAALACSSEDAVAAEAVAGLERTVR